ncbi:MAG: polyphenol oxidase family protein [Candidatus Cloacimonas sp.]|jgi:YfiH family protein|nr:polyphenol oxidase family protein [Candidatus Cloacimonas sp.]
MKIFFHLGQKQPDYRSIMREQQDFCLEGRNIPVSRLVIAEQTHSDLVHLCNETDCGSGLGTKPQIPIADGFISNILNQFLLIRTADCTPVILMDHKQMVVSALHSGREGTRKNISGKAVALMQKHYGCKPEDIVAYIGAGICHANYEVSEVVFNEYNSSMLQMGLYPATSPHRYIDIRLGIFQQLIQAGVTYKNIENIHDCTYESTNYHSFRREGSHNRQINLVGIVHE